MKRLVIVTDEGDANVVYLDGQYLGQQSQVDVVGELLEMGCLDKVVVEPRWAEEVGFPTNLTELMQLRKKEAV